MDSKQKQRIVGIIFLIILAVVAIPAFLKHSKENAVLPASEETQQMAQEQSQVLPNEPAPLEANQQPLATEQQPPSNAAPNPNPVSTPPVSSADGNMTQEQSLEPIPVPSEATPTSPLSSPASPTQSPVITEPSAPAPISAPPVKPEPVKKPVAIKKASKIEHQVEKTDWTIRLAIFSVRANADKLLSDLKKHGFHGSIEEINTYKGMTYKVTLKTKSSRADADKLAAKLNNLFHIKVMVNKTR